MKSIIPHRKGPKQMDDQYPLNSSYRFNDEFEDLNMADQDEDEEISHLLRQNGQIEAHLLEA